MLDDALLPPDQPDLDQDESEPLTMRAPLSVDELAELERRTAELTAQSDAIERFLQAKRRRQEQELERLMEDAS